MRDRDALRAEFGAAQVGMHVRLNGTMHTGAIDEYVWPAALDARGLGSHRAGLTHVDWGWKAAFFQEPNTTAQLLAGPAAGLAAGAAAAHGRRAATAARAVRGTMTLEVDVNQHGLPLAFNNATSAAAAVEAARADGKLFARKFPNTTEVMGVLIKAVA